MQSVFFSIYSHTKFWDNFTADRLTGHKTQQTWTWRMSLFTLCRREYINYYINIVILTNRKTERKKREINQQWQSATCSSGVVMLNLSESPLNGWNQSRNTTKQNTNTSQLMHMHVTLRTINKNSFVLITQNKGKNSQIKCVCNT